MKKSIALALSTCLILSACSGQEPSSDSANGRNITCLQGVQYYKFTRSVGNSAMGYLAPVFDAQSSKVKTCQTYVSNEIPL